MTYLLGFDHETSNDAHFEIEGIPCIMDKAHELYLIGMQVDWQDGLGNRGFTFKNPNAPSYKNSTFACHRSSPNHLQESVCLSLSV